MEIPTPFHHLAKWLLDSLQYLRFWFVFSPSSLTHPQHTHLSSARITKVLALPITLISTQFSETYSAKKKEEKDARIFKENEEIINNTDWEELLRVLDTRFAEYEDSLEKAKTAVETMEGAHKEMKIGLEVLRRRVKEQGIISQSDEKRTV